MSPPQKVKGANQVEIRFQNHACLFTFYHSQYICDMEWKFEKPIFKMMTSFQRKSRIIKYSLDLPLENMICKHDVQFYFLGNFDLFIELFLSTFKLFVSKFLRCYIVSILVHVFLDLIYYSWSKSQLCITV